RVEQTMSAAPAAAAASSSSFIVDTPAATPGRGTAQAADFGFTFEEEKQQQGGSALDYFKPTPAPPPAAPPPPPSPPKSPFSTDSGSVAPVTPPAGFSFDTPSPGFSFDEPAKTPTPPPAAPVAAANFDFS